MSRTSSVEWVSGWGYWLSWFTLVCLYWVTNSSAEFMVFPWSHTTQVESDPGIQVWKKPRVISSCDQVQQWKGKRPQLQNEAADYIYVYALYSRLDFLVIMSLVYPFCSSISVGTWAWFSSHNFSQKSSAFSLLIHLVFHVSSRNLSQ